MTNSSNKQEIMVFVFLIIMIVGGLVFVKQYRKNHNSNEDNQKQEKKEDITRVLVYHNDNFTYKLTQENDYISIKSESDLDCDVVDCDQLDTPTTEITDPEIKTEAKNLLSDLFKEEHSNYLEVSNNDLSIDQITSLELIINSLVEEEITYNIIKTPYKEKITSRGYAFTEENGKPVLVIALGEKKTGGYSIDVEKVIINGNNVTVYVNENSPKPSDVVTQAFTYPSVQIEFSRKPEKVIIINEKTKSPFKEIDIKNIDYKYTILTPSNNQNYPNMGYTVEKNTNGYLITIAMGKKETNGYSISIEKIEINNNKATIYVHEKTPGAIAVDATTYPIVQVTINELPDEINVISANTKTKYQEIKKEEQ